MNLVPKRLRRPWITEKVTYHLDPEPPDMMKTLTVHKLPCIVTPYPRFIEHPIYWWKMRHLRHDIKVMDPDFKRMVDEALDNAFLNGTGGL